ncbi:hypothetical protein [Vibrio salinus]|uniref:hypothetical protein n=1 Tax=Vibrio salinus TaxID=2899784 RepID=UPI001E2895B3|nr:hypothetical protein [Vibrio salinus]MCE0493065.1 hypothetical protein [Vibrio salinus]
MSASEISKEIETILNQLDGEGKEPTTALIKARLAMPVPIPAIIAALKSWKSSKRVAKVEIQQKPIQTPEARIEVLEDQISDLLTRVAHLEAQIEKRSK